MSTTVLTYTAKSLETLLAQANADLAPLLANKFTSMSFDARDEAYNKDYRLVITVESGGEVITSPMFLVAFDAGSLQGAGQELEDYIVANPTYFVSTPRIGNLTGGAGGGRTKRNPIIAAANEVAADGRIAWLASGAAPSGVAGGDLSGTYPNPIVAKVAGVMPTPIGLDIIGGTVVAAAQFFAGPISGVPFAPDFRHIVPDDLATGGTIGQVLYTDGAGGFAWANGAAGTVTSVGLVLPAEFTVTGSPVTSSGDLTGAWADQTTGKVFAAPNGSTGTPSFRALVPNDLATGGTNGQVLQTNGAGVFSWVSAGAILSSGQVGFGSGSNLLTGSANFTYVSALSTGGLTVSNTTDTTSSTTGAMVTAGGLGVAKNGFFGGSAVTLFGNDPSFVRYYVGNTNATDGATTRMVIQAASGSNSLLQLYLYSGFTTGNVYTGQPKNDCSIIESQASNGLAVIFSNQFNIGDGTNRFVSITGPNGDTFVRSTTASTTSADGALVVSGGAGVGGAINSANTITAWSGTFPIKLAYDTVKAAKIMGANNTYSGALAVGPTIIGHSNTAFNVTGTAQFLCGTGLSTLDQGNANVVIMGIGTSLGTACSNTIAIVNGGTITANSTSSIIIGRPNATGGNAVIIGRSASGAIDTVVIGSNAASTGSGSIAIGKSASTSTFTNAVAIGPSSAALANNQARIGGTTVLNLSVTGTITAESTTVSTSSTTGSLVVNGGAGIAKQLFVDSSGALGAAVALQVGDGTNNGVQICSNLNSQGGGGIYFIDSTASSRTSSIFVSTNAMYLGFNNDSTTNSIMSIGNSPSVQITALNGGRFGTTSTFSASSGVDIMFNHVPTVNQSGTAGYTAIFCNVTQTATGSGTKLLLQLQVGAADKFTVTSTGLTTLADATDSTTIANGSLVTAGGIGAAKNINAGGTVFGSLGLLTGQPSANGAGTWKLGKKITATVAFVTTDYVEVSVDGVVCKLALAA